MNKLFASPERLSGTLAEIRPERHSGHHPKNIPEVRRRNDLLRTPNNLGSSGTVATIYWGSKNILKKRDLISITW